MTSVIPCALAAASAGTGVGFFGCVLSSADRLKRQNGGYHSRRSRCACIFGATGSVSAGLGSIVGIALGPITLVTVVRAGTTLSSNVLFSQIFGLRPLVRDDLVGTLVTVNAVVCFIIFTGASDEDEDTGPENEAAFVEDITKPASVSWGIALVAMLAISCWWLFLRSRRMKSDSNALRALAVSTMNGVSSAVMDVTAKGWTAVLREGVNAAAVSPIFWGSVVLNITFLVIMRTGLIYGCRRCDVLVFLPLHTVTNIFLSVVTGLLVMQEWKTVSSWIGLVCSSFAILGGIIMLVTGPVGDDVSDPADAGDRTPESSPWELVPGEPNSPVPYSSTSSRRGGKAAKNWQVSPGGDSVDHSLRQQGHLEGAPEPPTSRPSSPADYSESRTTLNGTDRPPLVQSTTSETDGSWDKERYGFSLSHLCWRNSAIARMNRRHERAIENHARWRRLNSRLPTWLRLQLIRLYETTPATDPCPQGRADSGPTSAGSVVLGMPTPSASPDSGASDRSTGSRAAGSGGSHTGSDGSVPESALPVGSDRSSRGKPSLLSIHSAPAGSGWMSADCCGATGVDGSEGDCGEGADAAMPLRYGSKSRYGSGTDCSVGSAHVAAMGLPLPSTFAAPPQPVVHGGSLPPALAAVQMAPRDGDTDAGSEMLIIGDSDRSEASGTTRSTLW